MIPMQWTAPGPEDFVFHGPAGLEWLNKPMLQLIIAILLVTVFWIIAARKVKVRPTKGTFLLEFAYDFVRNGIARELMGQGYQPFVPLLLGMFSVILVSNLFGEFFLLMFPTFSNIGYSWGMTIFVFIMYVGIGFKAHGPGYLKQALLPPGLPAYMVPIVVPLEFISTFITRPLTLGIRLFANMFGGHIVVIVFVVGGSYLLTYSHNLVYNVAGVFSVLFSMVMMALEVFIAFMQAYIFTILTTQYISTAMHEAH